MGIVVRLFQFMNSFYRDKVEGDFEVRGDYCCLGYFDALNVKLIGIFENEVAGNMRERVYEHIVNTVDGKCSQKNIICVTENEQKDAEFWKKQEQMPYLFVTMIHVQHDENDRKNQINSFTEFRSNEQDSGVELESEKGESLVERVNKREDSIAYYTYDHCEVVIAHYDKSYDDGVNFIFKHLEDKRVYKLYSTFCILQTLVEDKEKLVTMIDKESVTCLLRASLKDFEEYEIFLRELKKIFSKKSDKNKTNVEMLENKIVANAELFETVQRELVARDESFEMIVNESEIKAESFKTLEIKSIGCLETSNELENRKIECIEAFKVLGSKDIVIEIREVPLEDLIECYSPNKEIKNDNLLNHNNQFYKNAFFNIESEILKARKRGETIG